LRVIVARHGDNQMAIAKKRGDMLLPFCERTEACAKLPTWLNGALTCEEPVTLQ